MAQKKQKQKHVPMRTCIGTGIKKPKKEMIRLVRQKDDSVIVDVTGKVQGRGANLDMTIEAFDAAVKKGAINRALKLDKALTPEKTADLREKFLHALEEKTFREGNKPVVVRIPRGTITE